MADDNNSSMHEYHERKHNNKHSGSGIMGGVYFMALLVQLSIILCRQQPFGPEC